MQSEIVRKFQEHDLGFLVDYGLEATYLVLMTLAASKRDLSDLHRLLPEYCLLSGEKLRKLKKLWESLRGTDRVSHKRVYDNGNAMAIMHHLCRGKGLQAWYGKMLECDRKPIKVNGLPFGHPAQITNRWCQIWTLTHDNPEIICAVASINGLPFHVYASCCRDENEILMILRVEARRLTLSNTMAIQQWAGSFELGPFNYHGVFRNQERSEVRLVGDVCFLTPSQPLDEFLQTHVKQETLWQGKNWGIEGRLTQGGFNEALERILRDKGIPVTKVWSLSTP